MDVSEVNIKKASYFPDCSFLEQILLKLMEGQQRILAALGGFSFALFWQLPAVSDYTLLQRCFCAVHPISIYILARVHGKHA